MLVTIFLDGLLYAATAVILAITAREFSLYNLAGGAWLILGGWLGAYAIGAPLGLSIPIKPGVFFLFLSLAVFQILSPRILRNILRKSPLSYLFVSLGMAIAITTFGRTRLLENSGATIPLESSWATDLLIVATAGAVAGLVLLFFKSQRWARLVLEFRGTVISSVFWNKLSGLVFLEICLLLLLGGISFSVHKGIFASAEYRTVIPILALVATGGKPLHAAGLSLIVVVGANLLEWFVPIAGGYSVPVAILALVMFFVKAMWPRISMLKARQIHVAIGRPPKGTFLKDPLILGGVALIAIISSVVLLTGLSNDAIYRAVLIAGLATISFNIYPCQLSMITISSNLEDLYIKEIC